MWTVEFSAKVKKAMPTLPQAVQRAVWLLVGEMRLSGPVAGSWPNYGKLGKNKHHCHLKKGHPTYVAVWNEDKGNISIEVVYVGTHEKAPY